MKCILDEIQNVILCLTGRNDLVVSGSYNEEQNRILLVQIKAGKTPISDGDLGIISELYGLKYQRVYDNRKKGYSRGLGRNIRYLMSINRIGLSLIL